MTEGVVELLQSYRASLLAWSEAQSDATVANRLYDQNRLIYRQLRESDEGRAGITGFLDDQAVAVRLMAAADTLAWAPELGVPVLEEIEQEKSLYGIDAKYTLRSYRAGKLNLD